MLLGLRKFFKGRNAILFHDLWERVFTYFVISNDTKSANFLENSLRTEINRLRMENKRQIIKILKLNLENHLSLSRAMSYALVVRDAPLPEGSGEPNNTFREQANFFKKANLIRHHFIRLPLLNYTNFNGPLTTRTLQNDIKIDSEKLKFTFYTSYDLIFCCNSFGTFFMINFGRFFILIIFRLGRV